jgi:hypothetical protein
MFNLAKDSFRSCIPERPPVATSEFADANTQGGVSGSMPLIQAEAKM